MQWTEKWKKYWQRLRRPSRTIYNREHPAPDEQEQMQEEILREWKEAYALWQVAEDEALIDAAIFRIKAAEKQYVYMMKHKAAKSSRQETQQGREVNADSR